MFHRRRVWWASSVHDSAELANKLTEQTWTLCQGFCYGGYYWLNDSLSEDGAQEYAVVRIADSVQVESITFGWMKEDRARAVIRDVLAVGGCEEFSHKVRAIVQTADEHGTCPHCA